MTKAKRIKWFARRERQLSERLDRLQTKAADLTDEAEAAERSLQDERGYFFSWLRGDEGCGYEGDDE